MSHFQTATDLFHACETLKGWEGCKELVADEALFTAQCEPLTEIATVQEYCEWMAAVGNGPLKGCSYKLHSSSYDEQGQTALFFATLASEPEKLLQVAFSLIIFSTIDFGKQV